MPSQAVSSELATGVCLWWGWERQSEKRQLSRKGALGAPSEFEPHPLSPHHGVGWRLNLQRQ